MLESRSAVIFSGGGARGAYSAGVALAFKQSRRFPELVSGTSVGALVAAMVAMEEEEKLVEIWRRLTPNQVYRKRLALNFLLSFVSNYVYPGYTSEPLATLIKTNIDSQRIRKSRRRLLVTCYNQTMQRVEQFDNHTSDLHTVLMASTALPLIFPPVIMGGHEYVDMGATNVPIKPVLAEGVEKVYVVLSDHEEDYKRPIRNNLDWAIQVMHLAQRDNLFLDIELAKRTNLAASQGSFRFVDLNIISPSRSLGLGFLDFHKRHQIQRAIQLGLEDGMRFLRENPSRTASSPGSSARPASATLPEASGKPLTPKPSSHS